MNGDFITQLYSVHCSAQDAARPKLHPHSYFDLFEKSFRYEGAFCRHERTKKSFHSTSNRITKDLFYSLNFSPIVRVIWM